MVNMKTGVVFVIYGCLVESLCHLVVSGSDEGAAALGVAQEPVGTDGGAGEVGGAAWGAEAVAALRGGWR